MSPFILPYLPFSFTGEQKVRNCWRSVDKLYGFYLLHHANGRTHVCLIASSIKIITIKRIAVACTDSSHHDGFMLRLKACSHYESNAHRKRINSHCLRSHWMRINRKSHSMRIHSIHFHRWFETGLKPYCVIILLTRDVLAGIIYICAIDFHEHINENRAIKNGW